MAKSASRSSANEVPRAPQATSAVKSIVFCSLLALQFGLQPILASKFQPKDVSKTSIVIGTELGKIIIAIVYIMGLEPKAIQRKIVIDWSLSSSLKIAAIPAILYALQNVFVQYGYVLLDSMTFNLLNQTKTLSAAFFLWALMGSKQSYMQLVALFLLLAAAIMLNLGKQTGKINQTQLPDYTLGVAMVAGASLLSGVSGALTQRALSDNSAGARHSVFFSAELAVYGILVLLLSAVVSADGAKVLSSGLFAHWDIYTLIPVVANAFGGVIVGQVTKYAGGVVKGFALIAGIIITGVVQWLTEDKPLTTRDWVAVLMVSLSIYLHSKYPVPKESVKKD